MIRARWAEETEEQRYYGRGQYCKIRRCRGVEGEKLTATQRPKTHFGIYDTSATHNLSDPQQWRAMPPPCVPPSFPSYYFTQDINEIVAYLASTRYVTSLGGLSLTDLKYGILVLPVGEESLPISPKPDNVMGHEFLDALDDANRTYDRALRMRNVNKDAKFITWPLQQRK